MNRRQMLASLAGFAMSPTTRGEQNTSRLPRLSVFAQVRPDDSLDAIRGRWTDLLAPHGLHPGTNIELMLAGPPQGATDIPSWERAARQLIDARPDVIVLAGVANARMFKRLGNAIPVVFSGVEDPVAEGLVESLRRPGGNMTGFVVFGGSLHAKRLELLKEIKPSLKRVANLESRDYREANESGHQWLENAAGKLGVDVARVLLPDYSSAETIMKALHEARAEAMLWGIFEIRRRDFAALLELFQESKLLHVLADHRSAEAGALMALGESIQDRHGREQIAAVAVRILRGESPATIPVVQVSRIELTINLATARRMALHLPPAVLARADRVISETKRAS